MKRFETWRTWLVIIGLLIFGALASVVIPALADEFAVSFDIGAVQPDLGAALDDESATVPVPDELAGLPVVENLVDDDNRANALLVLVVLLALIVPMLVGMGLALGFLFRLLDRQVEAVKEDDDYQEHVAALDQRQKERSRTLQKEQPPGGIPDHERTRWAVVSTSLVILFFVILAAFALADTFYPDGDVELFGQPTVNPALPLAGAMGLVAALLLVMALAPRRGMGWTLSDDTPISWNTIWLIISGLIFLGVGIGLAVAVYFMEGTTPVG